jgi:hypothetical protein
MSLVRMTLFEADEARCRCQGNASTVAVNSPHNLLRMTGGDYRTIWQASDWPAWQFDLAALTQPLADVSRAQGMLMGRLADVGMALRDQASLSVLTQDVVKTSEIEVEPPG